MTMKDLRNEMSAAEFTEWVAFYSYEAKMQAEAEREAKRKGGRR
jgi:hypothetical protein